MAELTDLQRQKISTGLQRYWSRFFEPVLGMTKADLKAAVDATDTWIDSNAASYNNALPAVAKANLSAVQKTLVFCVVAAFRVSKELAVQILGGVD